MKRGHGRGDGLAVEERERERGLVFQIWGKPEEWSLRWQYSLGVGRRQNEWANRLLDASGSQPGER